MNWRLRKFFFNGTHLLLAVCVLLTIFNWFPLGRACGCIVVAGGSMALLLAQFGRLLRGYFDRFCRLEVYVPVINGLALGALALLLSPQLWITLTALLQMAGWLLIYAIYHRHGRNYVTIGDGPLPKGVWLNVPYEAIRPGDLLLMSGRISRLTRNSVGHVELVVLMDNGRLGTITAYIEKGIVLWKTVRALCKVQVNDGGHYIVLRPLGGFTPEQNRLAIEFAQRKYEANREKVEADTPRVHAFINWILPDSLCNRRIFVRFLPKFKQRLLNAFIPTGYDSISMRFGTHRRDLWTCNWIVLKTLEAAGVPVEEHESGFLGLGTGLLNFPYPISLMLDRHFRLLDETDKPAFETPQATLA